MILTTVDQKKLLKYHKIFTNCVVVAHLSKQKESVKIDHILK